MRKYIIFLSTLIYLFFCNSVNASETGKFMSLKTIEVADELTILPGHVVKFLGVIDVPVNIASSGRLATFRYKEQIYSADAVFFERITEDNYFSLYPPRTFDNGTSAAVCTTLTFMRTGDVVDLSKTDISRFIQVKSDGKIETDYSVLKPKDSDGYSRDSTDFCIEGLAHSSSYKVSVLPGLTAFERTTARNLASTISIVAKTADMKSNIQTDPSKNILANRNGSVVPINITNVNKFDVSLYRIDLNSLSSYSDIFRSLNQNDLRRLKSFWGEHLGTKSIEIQSQLNKTKKVNLNLDQWLNDAKPGLFVATFESEELDRAYWDPIPTQWFMISNIATQIFNGRENTDVFTTQFETLEAIKDASIQVIAKNNKILFRKDLSSDGHIKIPNQYLKGSGGFAPEIIIISSEIEGTTILDVTSLSKKPRILEGGVSKRYDQDVYLTTDRNIYRQSDTIHLFGTARKLDLKPIPNETYSITLKNQSGNEVASQQVNTNKFGVFSANVDLRANYPLGRYTLNVEKVDGTILAIHELSIEDFVPLTIEPKLSAENEIWKLNQAENIVLKAEYFSGGPAAGLDAELIFKLKPQREHLSEKLKGYIFGQSNFNNDYNPVPLRESLSNTGSLDTSIDNKFNLLSRNLFNVSLEGTVFDVGGRPNKTRLTIPLDTEASYVGLQPVFNGRVDEGSVAQFDIVNIDRAGDKLGLGNISYEVKRIIYDYNWYYNNGWRWRRVRVDHEVVETGDVEQARLSLKSGLDWGRYEITAKNQEGFRTDYEFYVGWGADTKPASEPEELVVFYDKDKQTVKFNAPFSGKAKVVLADHDIRGTKTVDVAKGATEIYFPLEDINEPGAHVLLSLSRAIQENTEHLPQIAVGKTWVERLSESRRIDIKFESTQKLRSTEKILAEFSLSQETGSAIVFLVDDGIHAVTSYENLNLQNHYFSERELQLGFLSNFGQLIQQDKSLTAFKMGGGDELSAKLGSIEKSDFFKTVAAASPLLDIVNGKISHEFEAANMEGRFRAVAMVVNEQGFGMATAEITVQDPVSIDISLPRFTAPGDLISGKIRLRSNSFEGELEIVRSIGELDLKNTITLTEGSSQDLLIPLQVETSGKIPIKIEAKYADQKIIRSFELISRAPVYPTMELRSFNLAKTNWLGRSTTRIPQLSSEVVEVDAADTTIEVSLMPSVGINLKQAVSALNRYPYGCIEQTSSGLRGVIAFAQINGAYPDTRTKINAGINRIINKQRNSGAFGYWGKYSSVYERFQPYALETLQLAMPYADDQEHVLKAISKSLEYIYRSNFREIENRIYAYGLLAKSGYEVTSRIRYELDRVLDTERSNIDNKIYDQLILSYWAASKINDSKRMEKINNIFADIAFEFDENTNKQKKSFWFDPSSTVNLQSKSSRFHSQKYGHLLADISERHLTTEILNIRKITKDYLSRLTFRSTLDNAKIVTLFSADQETLNDISVQIDGQTVVVGKDGVLPLSKDQLANGFEIKHNNELSLSINAELVGSPKNNLIVDNGYSIEKWWFNADGDLVDNAFLNADQGQLFTVVIYVKKTSRFTGGDLLLTDLLPTGFEIEEASLTEPYLDSIGIYEENNFEPDYRANLDDRFIAHFEDGLPRNKGVLISYVVRAAYPGELQIGGAHIEHMYAPDQNGRSASLRGIVLEK